MAFIFTTILHWVSCTMFLVSFFLMFQPALLPFWGQTPDMKSFYFFFFSCMAFFAGKLQDDAYQDKWRISIGMEPREKHTAGTVAIMLSLYAYLLWCAVYKSDSLGSDGLGYAVFFSICIATASIGFYIRSFIAVYRQQQTIPPAIG